MRVQDHPCNQAHPGVMAAHVEARKPRAPEHNEVASYFYYTAGKEGRTVALATSKDLRSATTSLNRLLDP